MSGDNENISIVRSLTYDDDKKHNIYRRRKIVIGYL